MSLNQLDKCDHKGCDQPWVSILVGPKTACAEHRHTQTIMEV